jgi:glycosyltransferase involved in cell wall biosynthesis
VKILHVLTEPKGGGGAYAVALARAAAARGDRVLLASPRPLAAGLPEIRLRRGSLVRLRRASRNADLVHLHGVRAALVRPLLARRHVVITTHGLHALRASRGLRKRAVSLATRSLLRDLDAIVCVSEAEARDLRELRLPLARTHVVLNGVPAVDAPGETQRHDARRLLGIGTDAFVVLFVGSLIHQKNPHLALEAAAIARRSRPDLVLLVAGDGVLRADLENHGYDGTRLLGHRSDMDLLYAAADMLLNTSRWEGLSLSLLEGLWRRLPLVVTDGPGNDEAAGDAGLVTPQEPDAVAAAILKLAHDPGLRAAMAERARARAESLFGEDEMVQRTLAIYDTVARGAAGRRRNDGAAGFDFDD